MDSRATLGEARIHARLTQHSLAERAGVSRATVGRIESGAVVPRVDTLDKLLAAAKPV